MSIPNATLSVDVTLETLLVDQKVTVKYDCFIFCGHCQGQRIIRDWRRQRPCPECHGKGGHYKRESFIASLDPGIIDINGFSCRFDKRGHQLGREYRSDLELTVNVLPHSTFTPEGKDLICQVPLSPLQAMFGGEIVFPVLGGTETRYVDEPSEGSWRSEGMGGYAKGDSTRGDIKYRFVTMSSKDATEKKVMARISDLESQVQEKKDAITGQEAQHQMALREERERFEEIKGEIKSQANKEIQQAVTQTALTFAKSLLPSIDSLEKALVAMDNLNDEGHRQGIEMILSMQHQTLAQHGIEAVPALGKSFDPHIHEAVAMDTQSKLPKNTVSEVLQTGYQHNGKLLRPAMVRVSG